MEKEVIYTGDIPQCPHCEKPTKRTGGTTSSTCMYFPPTYDENGVNINPDRNMSTIQMYCLECTNSFSISGNNSDGFKYN